MNFAIIFCLLCVSVCAEKCKKTNPRDYYCNSTFVALMQVLSRSEVAAIIRIIKPENETKRTNLFLSKQCGMKFEPGRQYLVGGQLGQNRTLHFPLIVDKEWMSPKRERSVRWFIEACKPTVYGRTYMTPL